VSCQDIHIKDDRLRVTCPDFQVKRDKSKLISYERHVTSDEATVSRKKLLVIRWGFLLLLLLSLLLLFLLLFLLFGKIKSTPRPRSLTIIVNDVFFVGKIKLGDLPSSILSSTGT